MGALAEAAPRAIAPRRTRSTRGGGRLSQLCCGKGDGNIPLKSSRGVAEIISGKQPNGPTGKIRLAFLDRYTRFVNVASNHGGGDY